jgi:hypothetical protein
MPKTTMANPQIRLMTVMLLGVIAALKRLTIVESEMNHVDDANANPPAKSVTSADVNADW